MAQIIFLGTAGSPAVVSKQMRSSGGIILQMEDLQFHIDPGPGTLNKAKEYGVNVQHNSAVLVSHNHVSHCNDLNAVIDAMTHGGIEHRGILLSSKSVLHNLEGSHPFLTKYHQSLVEKIIPMEKSHKIGIELVEIHALSAEHTDPTAIGFKFFCPKFTLSYSGDTKLTPALLEEMKGSDILILNVPYLGEDAKGMNLDIGSAIKLISSVRPKLAVMTHFGLEFLKSDPIHQVREVQRITGVQTIAANDGLIISPGYGQYQVPVKGYS
ncbi:MAG: MBL fold metallo-hydrolase [Nanoarchaeota archaeon]